MMNEDTMLKKGTGFVERGGLRYTVGPENRVRRFRPWLGDAFSFLYDAVMEKSVFPKKFAASREEHERILRRALDGVYGKRVLEIAAGSGSAVRYLDSGNSYTGTDISPGLLRRAVKRFGEAGFEQPLFYVASADELPFRNESFDVCLCMLSLNFFPDVNAVLEEVERVLVEGGVFVCAAAVPERKETRSPVRGRLYSEDELARMCEARRFRFDAMPDTNGALLYFRATVLMRSI